MDSRSHSSSRSHSQSRGVSTNLANEARGLNYTDTYRRASKIDQLFSDAKVFIGETNRLPSSPPTHTITEQAATSSLYLRPEWNDSHQHHVGHQHHVSHNASHHESTSSLYVSPVEKLILDSTQPIETPKPSIIETIPGTHLSGVLLNHGEAEEWTRRTGLNINQYTINNNFNDAERITKDAENIEVVQELGVRYLKPPLLTPPPIIVQQVPRPGPPVIIRAQESQEETVVYREEPPPKPHMDTVTLEVDVPSSRRVIVEKLPPRPRSVIVEKWLPYRFGKREVRVIQNRQAIHQRNLIIQWNAASVKKIRKCKDLGVVHMDPEEYKIRWRGTLLKSHQLPTCDDHEFNHNLASSSNFQFSTIHQSSSGHSHVKDIGGGNHLVTQRADCPCKSDCKCRCHSGGYIINSGNTHQHTTSISTRPAQVVTSTSDPLYCAAIQGCVCCCTDKQTGEQQQVTVTSSIRETCSSCPSQTNDCGSDCVCCW